MNYEEHLLACLAEECSEVAKNTSKAFRNPMIYYHLAASVTLMLPI